MTKKLETLVDFDTEARRFVEALQPTGKGATLITLSGDLGAGKTTFTQAVARALGVEDTVNSPTFVIEKIYGLPPREEQETLEPGYSFEHLIHIDAYRLTSAGELNALGFGEIMSKPENLIMLEWPENVTGVLEQAFVKILLEHLPDGSRQITYA